jgi:hypothetical protein
MSTIDDIKQRLELKIVECLSSNLVIGKFAVKHIEDCRVSVGNAEFMRDLDLNPKIVWESTRKLREGGLLTKSPDGKYRCSDPGLAGFLMVSSC